MRLSEINRKTNETDILLKINLDGSGKSNIDSGCGFLNHMLTLFSSHGRFDLDVKCIGDIDVDYHHSVEDIGIALGQALNEALGDKKGINRYGDNILSMDESLILTSLDFSGRASLSYDLGTLNEKVGDFDTELIEEFFLGFVRNANCALHVRKLEGKNTHHIIEGAFKSFGRSLRQAVKIDKDFENEIPSTKGVL